MINKIKEAGWNEVGSGVGSGVDVSGVRSPSGIKSGIDREGNEDNVGIEAGSVGHIGWLWSVFEDGEGKDEAGEWGLSIYT